MADIDVAAVRADTPGCGNVVHFNNAGAGLMATPVLDAVVDHLRLESEIGGYEAHDKARDAFVNTYRALARFLNCGTDESTPEGEIDVAALENMIDARTKLIAITHIPTNGGLINPAAAVGKVARAAAIPYLLDACQSAGQVPLDVEAIGCDMLSVTGRKYLRGPRGTGFLYIRKNLLSRLEPPMIDLHGAVWTAPDAYTLRDDAKRFENWEFNVAGQIGLGVAVDYANALGQDAIHARIRGLADRLRAELAEIPGVTLRDIGREKGGIVIGVLDVVLDASGGEGSASRAGLQLHRLDGFEHAPRYDQAWPRCRGAGIRALLQHGRRDRAVLPGGDAPRGLRPSRIR